jgi:hypothetical protein
MSHDQAVRACFRLFETKTTYFLHLYKIYDRPISILSPQPRNPAGYFFFGLEHSASNYKSIGIPIRDLCALKKWCAVKCCLFGLP